MRIGYLGFGEVGSEFATGFQGPGVSGQVAFDAMREHPALGPTIAARAAAAGTTLLPSPAALAEAADVLFLAVPCAVADDALASLAPFLGGRHLLVDVTASSGEAKKRRAPSVEATGAAFVDVALMGPVSTNGIRVPALVSGPGAETFRERFAPLGMSLEVVSAQAGDASAVKMIRSVFTKGIMALLVEMLVAARRAGVEALALSSVVRTMEEAPFAATANRYVCGVAVHATRQAAEMHEVIATLTELGVEPITAQATLRRLQRIAEAGLREAFQGIRPKGYGEVVEALERAAARRPGPA
jgi:3-hydroxyisobutyrate dehydrogenase-like beta-hydroxyacid dehydrogenase